MYAGSVSMSVFGDAIDCSLPCSSVYGILQPRILKWLSFPPPRDLTNLGDGTHISCISLHRQADCFATESPGNPMLWIAGFKCPIQNIHNMKTLD